MSVQNNVGLGSDGERIRAASDLVAQLRSPDAVRYLLLVTGKAIPDDSMPRGRIEKELVSVLRQLDGTLGVSLAGLSVEEQLTIIERRGEMLGELNRTWAENLAKNAKLDRQAAFRSHLKKLVLMERALLLEGRKRSPGAAPRPGDFPPPPLSATREREEAKKGPTEPLAALSQPTASPWATRGPRRGA